MDNYGNPLSVEKQKEFIDYVFDNSDYIQKYISKEAIKEGNEDILNLLDGISDISLSMQDRAEAADTLKHQMKDIVKNVPKHLQKTVESKMNAYVDSMLKTSNETAKAQALSDRSTARKKMQEQINEMSDIDRAAFNDVLAGEYKSKISSAEKGNASEVKGKLMGLIRSNVEFSQYIPLLNYMDKNPNSPLKSYILDSLYDLNKLEGYNSKEDSQTKKNIRARLDTLISILPNYELAEQSNIRYNGN